MHPHSGTMDVDQELKETPDESLVEHVSEEIIDKQGERVLVRKQDMVIIPLLCLNYVFGYLVRQLDGCTSCARADHLSRRTEDRLGMLALWALRKL